MMTIPRLSQKPLLDQPRACQELLLTSLGWKFAKEGKKALDFSQVFDVLGISLDLSGCNKGNFSINNKASRVEKILSQVDQFVTRGSVTPQLRPAQVHGILNFAQGQYLGRVLQPAMRFFPKNFLARVERKPEVGAGSGGHVPCHCLAVRPTQGP